MKLTEDQSGDWRRPALDHDPRFAHHIVQLGEIRLHYVEGGDGTPIVLLHGWPQTWYAWRKILPALADAGFRVIAPDMRGLGHSTKPASGRYDKRSVAEDMHELLGALGLPGACVVGHDHGAAVAYAWAEAYPDDVRRLVFLDMALMGAGLETLMDHRDELRLWALSFHMAPDIAEGLLENRERMYLSWYYRMAAFDQSTWSEADIDVFAATYSRPRSMMLEYYRSFYEDQRHNRDAIARGKLAMPVMALGGTSGLKDLPLASMQAVATDVRGGTIDRCGHYIAEERPDALVALLLPFLADAA